MPSNRLESEKMPGLVLKLGIPIMLSMTLQALYNVIDSIYVSRLGDESIAAVSLAFPFQQIVVAIATGIGIGTSMLVARLLGQQKDDEANKAGSTALTLALLIGVTFLLTGPFLASLYVNFYTDSPLLGELARNYIGISITFCLFQIVGSVICFMLQGTGRTMQTLLCLSVGCIANILLDPLFIFAFHLEVKGAAIASVIGQMLSLMIAILLLKKNPQLSCYRKGETKLAGPLVKQILGVGLPTMLLQISGCISLSLVNKILIGFTPLAVTTFGLYIKVESFVFLPMHGMSFSLVPVTSYNYGSRNKERILSALKWSLIYTYLFMALGFLVFQTKPQLLIALFSPSEALRSLSGHAFKRISLCFIGAPVIYLTAGFLQGFGKGFQAMLITLLRQVLGVLPSAYLLARTIGLDGVWYCYFCGDIVGVSVSLILLYRLHETTIKKMTMN